MQMKDVIAERYYLYITFQIISAKTRDKIKCVLSWPLLAL